MRLIRTCSSSSTAFQICSSSWPARSTPAPPFLKSSGSCGNGKVAQIPDVAAAYDTCLQLARTHYENFPVASWLMPPPARPHIAAIYAFARIADDFADEGY